MVVVVMVTVVMAGVAHVAGGRCRGKRGAVKCASRLGPHNVGWGGGRWVQLRRVGREGGGRGCRRRRKKSWRDGDAAWPVHIEVAEGRLELVPGVLRAKLLVHSAGEWDEGRESHSQGEGKNSEQRVVPLPVSASQRFNYLARVVSLGQ